MLVGATSGVVLPDLGNRRTGSRLDQSTPDLDLSGRLVGVYSAQVRDLNVHCPIASTLSTDLNPMLRSKV